MRDIAAWQITLGIALYERGMSLREAATQAEMGTQTLREYMVRTGTPRRRVGRPANGPVTPGEILAARYRAGQSLRELAASTGMSYHTVREQLIARGVRLRPQGRAAAR